MLQYLAAYAAACIVFLGLDLLWLGVVAKSFYFSRLGHLMADQVNVSAAGVFYLAYIVGILLFAVVPALQSDSWRSALLWGALFGFFCYGTYEFTNLATLRDWPLAVVAADVAWGSALTGVAALSGFFAARLLGGS